MGRLVALNIPPGPDYVEAIRRIWDDGDAIAPVDPRLPAGEAERALAALRPAAVLEPDGQLRPLPDGQPTEPGDAVVLATSGTSGQPKAVVHTHDSVRASAEATSAALDVDPERDRWLACLPLAHIGGLSVVLRSIVTGTAVEIHPTFDPQATIEAADRGATLVSLVTRALQQIPAQRFRVVLLGGAAPPLDPPANVVTTYGMTETGSGVVYRGPALGRAGTVALDGLEIIVGDPSAGARPGPVPGAEGEIHLRGPMLFRGYRQGPDPFLPDGWFPTGDLGHWSEHGELVVDGRRGDVIVTGGEKVWPEPVERVLAQRSDLAEVAIVGRPDPDWGHRVTAVVVVADGCSTPTVDALRDTVVDELPVWAAPKAVEVVEQLPRTSLGKVQRRSL